MVNKPRIVTVVGARPQFLKAAPLSRALKGAFRETIVHTGQHYDWRMSGAIFQELRIPKPKYNLGIGSGTHGAQTGAMLAGIERVLLKERPRLVVVYGDTNSTVAGALAAAKLNIPVAHVEAGMRSFDTSMPEELNRIVTDRLSMLLFCPSPEAIKNLRREGITKGVYAAGDNMLDVLFRTLPRAEKESSRLLHKLHIERKKYLLMTVHRASNTDRPKILKRILRVLRALNEPVVFPIHPRTQAALKRFGLAKTAARIPHLQLLPPQGYISMLALLKNCRLVLTDSGGVQKEAYALRVPCVTLRKNTEWVETVRTGWNVLASPDPRAISRAVQNWRTPRRHPQVYGTGHASEEITRVLRKFLARR